MVLMLEDMVLGFRWLRIRFYWIRMSMLSARLLCTLLYVCYEFCDMGVCGCVMSGVVWVWVCDEWCCMGVS